MELKVRKPYFFDQKLPYLSSASVINDDTL